MCYCDVFISNSDCLGYCCPACQVHVSTYKNRSFVHVLHSSGSFPLILVSLMSLQQGITTNDTTIDGKQEPYVLRYTPVVSWYGTTHWMS